MFSAFTIELVVFVLCVAVIVILLCVFIIIAVYRYQQKQFLYSEELKELRSIYENNILSSKIEIQEQTFQQISQEIHDNIGQKLTLAKLYLNTINFYDRIHSEEKVKLSLQLISDSILRLRELSRGLSTDSILNNGLVKAIDNEVKVLNNTGVVKAEFNINGNELFLSDKSELIIFRIIQECINNFVRHSKGEHLKIEISYGDNLIEIAISDDGIGIVSSNISGVGLINIRKRAELLGGVFKINSSSAGTLIEISIPICSNLSTND